MTVLQTYRGSVRFSLAGFTVLAFSRRRTNENRGPSFRMLEWSQIPLSYCRRHGSDRLQTPDLGANYLRARTWHERPHGPENRLSRSWHGIHRPPRMTGGRTSDLSRSTFKSPKQHMSDRGTSSEGL